MLMAMLNDAAKYRGVQNPTTDSGADFEARATADGVLYATNFNSVYVAGVIQPSRAISDSTSLRAESTTNQTGAGITGSSSGVNYDTSLSVSGNGSLRLDTLDSASTQTGSWAFAANGTNTATKFKRLYIQFLVRYPRETLEYRWKESGSNGYSTAEMKILNMEDYGGGQAVLYVPRFYSFPTVFVNGSELIAGASQRNLVIASGSNPWGVSIYRMQDAIDGGGTPSTKTEFFTKYGPLYRADADWDLTYNTSTLIGDRSQPSGWPDTRAAINGFAISADTWTVFEVFLEYNLSDASQSSVQVWASDYGDSPKLILDDVGSVNFSASDVWGHLEFLNYDAERLSEVGVRPTLYTYFGEVIVSENPIAWPVTGGFPPNNQGGNTAFSQAAATLIAGDSANYTISGLDSTALATVQWENRFFFDASKSRAHLFGKNAQSQGSERCNMLYDATSDTWSYSIYGGSELGHVYESFAYDPQDEKFYVGIYGHIQYLKSWAQGQALNTFVDPETSDYGTWITYDLNPSCCWHPNLFGVGDGGVVTIHDINTTNIKLIAWRKSTDTWHDIPSGTDTLSGSQIASCSPVYVTSMDAVIVPLKISGGGSTWKVPAGSGGSLGTATTIADVPINCVFTGAGGNVGMLFDDPLRVGAPYILEKGGTNRVWKYNSGTDAWDLKAYTHPFPAGSATSDTNWTVASCYPDGVFWSIRNTTTSPTSMLWRPDD